MDETDDIITEKFDLSVLSENVLLELQRRTSDGRVEDISGASLVTLARELIKMGEKGKEDKEDVSYSILDHVALLPAERAAILLRNELHQKQNEIVAIREALDALREPSTARKVLR